MTYDEIKTAWNAQADDGNRWHSLSEAEKIEWAFDCGAGLSMATPDLMKALKLIANAENSALDLAYCKGIARAAIANALGEQAAAHVFASYTKGTCDWKDSLVKRPEVQ